eukprot:4572956-Prymnesium_polylepis.1
MPASKPPTNVSKKRQHIYTKERPVGSERGGRQRTRHRIRFVCPSGPVAFQSRVGASGGDPVASA